MTVNSNKQFKYASFNARLIANLIDSFILMVFMLPVSMLNNVLIYGKIKPNIFLQNFLKNNLEQQKFSSVTEFVSYVTRSPEIYKFFVEEHNLLFIFLDCLIQLIAVSVLIYYSWIKFNSSPGKMLFSLKIVDEHSLMPITKKQSLARAFAIIISVIPLLLGFVWQIFSKKHQTWHDMIAGTVVIKK